MAETYWTLAHKTSLNCFSVCITHNETEEWLLAHKLCFSSKRKTHTQIKLQFHVKWDIYF